MHQERFEEALGELAEAGSDEMEDPLLHGLRAIALSRLDRHQQALDSARQAITLAPDIDYGHYVLAVVHLRRGSFTEARDAIRIALDKDPTDATNLATLANIECGREQWSAALDAAERGLANDPAHDGCRQARTVALMKLGRMEEANRDVSTLLADNPNDAETHDTQGWMFLHQGNADAARRHFLEALRLEPNHASARDGLVHALKARHQVFSVILRGLLFMSRFRSWALWGMVLGVILAMRFGDAWAQSHPQSYLWVWAAQTLVWCLLVAVMAANPLFDLVIRLSREGRLALPPDQTRASNWNALCLGLALLLMVLWAWKGGRLFPLMAYALVCLTSVVSSTFAASAGWVRRRMVWIAWFAALLIPAAYVMPIVFLLVAVQAKIVAPLLIKVAFYMLAGSMLIATFSDDIADFLEKRRPDEYS
jgi:tetratricopeptide (TPR) repeat protein